MKLYDEAFTICAVGQMLLRQSNEGKWAQQGKYIVLRVSVQNPEGRRSLLLLSPELCF